MWIMDRPLVEGWVRELKANFQTLSQTTTALLKVETEFYTSSILSSLNNAEPLYNLLLVLLILTLDINFFRFF